MFFSASLMTLWTNLKSSESIFGLTWGNFLEKKEKLLGQFFLQRIVLSSYFFYIHKQSTLHIVNTICSSICSCFGEVHYIESQFLWKSIETFHQNCSLYEDVNYIEYSLYRELTVLEWYSSNSKQEIAFDMSVVST